MIEIEPLQSAVSDETLRLVASFCGREVAEKLLYVGDAECTIISCQQQKHSSATA